MALGAAVVDLVALVMTLSWSRKRAVVWARSKDMLSWQAHTACFRRLGGVPARLADRQCQDRGVEGRRRTGREVNPTCRHYAGQLKFHVDACQPQAKGKVERGIGDQRGTDEVVSGSWWKFPSGVLRA